MIMAGIMTDLWSLSRIGMRRLGYFWQLIQWWSTNRHKFCCTSAGHLVSIGYRAKTIAE
jgi:hypothetical protein